MPSNNKSHLLHFVTTMYYSSCEYSNRNVCSLIFVFYYFVELKKKAAEMSASSNSEVLSSSTSLQSHSLQSPSLNPSSPCILNVGNNFSYGDIIHLHPIYPQSSSGTVISNVLLLSSMLRRFFIPTAYANSVIPSQTCNNHHSH